MEIVGFSAVRIFASVFGSIFYHNKAQVNGGGVHFQDILSVKMLHTIFTSNRAVTFYGGGALLWVST